MLKGSQKGHWHSHLKKQGSGGGKAPPGKGKGPAKTARAGPGREAGPGAGPGQGAGGAGGAGRLVLCNTIASSLLNIKVLWTLWHTGKALHARLIVRVAGEGALAELCSLQARGRRTIERPRFSPRK